MPKLAVRVGKTLTIRNVTRAGTSTAFDRAAIRDFQANFGLPILCDVHKMAQLRRISLFMLFS